jgi:hypothetical protein
MEGGAISGNIAATYGGGASVEGAFTLKGGRIQGITDSDGFTKNIANDGKSAALRALGTAEWGTGGTYTKGGVSQTSGSDIGDTDDTLLATPAQ